MKRLPMRKIRDVLRLSAEGLSTRQIAASLSIGRTSLRGYIDRATELGLSWPLPPEMSDTDLEHRLFDRGSHNTQRIAVQPDWACIHRELRRKGVTLSLLWEEYRGDHPEGYGYSRFCELYTRWEGKLSPEMRQRHPAGERLFVDYAGHTIDVIDPKTGEVRTAQLFVAALGASSYTFAEVTWTQSLPDWIASHVRAFGFFGGVTAQIVSDNLKAGVTKACFYDPAINRTYADLATHYDTAVVPARPHKPKDKAKVEGAVLLVERWVLARLRNRQFFSLEEVNAAIRPLLGQLNDKASRHLGTSRRQLFVQLDKPALKPLPLAPYVYAEWKKCRAGLDYHIAIDKHYYSVPFQFLKKELWARITSRTIEEQTIKVEINGQMLYVPVEWAGRIEISNSDIEYDNQKPRIDIVYRAGSFGHFNRATRPWNAGEVFWNTDLWPDFRAFQIVIRSGSTKPLGKSLGESFPNGWWPLPNVPDPLGNGVGFIECDRRASEVRAEFGLYWNQNCSVMRRVADGLGVRYQWNRIEVGEANERQQDLRVQRLVEWLLTPPGQRTARPID